MVQLRHHANDLLQIFHDSIVSQIPKEIPKENQTKYINMTKKPRSHVRIVVYRTCATVYDILFHVYV